MSAKPGFYITTAIDYVNSEPHLGTAYEKIAADVIARSRRMAGFDVFFSMGNDEHSQNVEREARTQGLEPLAYTDRMARQFEATWKRLNISYDRFIRTTEPAHRRAVEEIFRLIEKRGDIYRARYAGLYCVSCEAFYQEKDLVDGLCPQHRVKPQWIEEENYFFALSRYRDALLEHVRRSPSFIQPEIRRNEIVRVLEGGLEDVSVSRAGKTWGIPLPADPAHVTYVWFDALINYVTAAGFPDDAAGFARRWPANVHVIGKDITRFHCIIWPAMLLSAGIALPECVFGHGFVTFKGEKMSKSLGHIVKPLEAVELLGPDPLRYFLMREIVFGKDGDFSWEAFIVRYNADLANDLGNLLNRALTMVTRYLDGRVPAPGSTSAVSEGTVARAAADLREVAREVAARYSSAIERWEFHAALGATWDLVRRANRLVEEAAPWTLASQGQEGHAALEFTLYHLLESCREIALQVAPVMPAKAEEMWVALGLKGRAAEGRIPDDLAWRDRWEPAWATGRIEPGAALFPRIDDRAASKGKGGGKDETGGAKEGTGNAKGGDDADAKAAKPGAPMISYADFARIQLRVATIRAAERVPKTDKLLRLEIHLGDETRQIVAGIGGRYAPESLVGKQVIVVANLEPATLRGVRSEGMLLAATGDDGSVILVPEAPVPPGAGVK